MSINKILTSVFVASLLCKLLGSRFCREEYKPLKLPTFSIYFILNRNYRKPFNVVTLYNIMKWCLDFASQLICRCFEPQLQ